jgi:hypothetical protein
MVQGSLIVNFTTVLTPKRIHCFCIIFWLAALSMAAINKTKEIYIFITIK